MKFTKHFLLFCISAVQITSSVSMAQISPTYTIPVIVHVIHSGGITGSGDNISTQQIYSQIDVLNADFAGTGLNSNLVPAAFSSLVSNTGITFCPALYDPAGNVLSEPGVDRIHAATEGLAPAPYTNIGYINTSIKPGCIWNVTKYCNIWVMDMGPGLTGFSTYPFGSGLSGLPGPFGTSSNDGIVVNYRYFGNTGAVIAPYNTGRVAVHEMGHWLGLLHLNGDSNCGSDLCADTPTQDVLHTGCISSSTPYNPDVCGAGTSPNGLMTMNFMDNTDDSCRYMFTPDQTSRMLTAIANAPARNGPVNQGSANCYSNPVAPTAGFSVPSGICSGFSVVLSDTSLGFPYTWNWVVNPGTGVTINYPSAQNPFFTFANPGTYTISLAVSNGVGADTSVQIINVQNCMQTLSKVSDLALDIFPNPSNGTFTLSSNDPLMLQSAFDLKIYNMLGEEVYTTLPAVQKQMSVTIVLPPALQNGLYIIYLISDKQVAKRLIEIRK